MRRKRWPFYESAFSAVVLYRSPSPSGVGEHIHIKVWSSLVQISTEEPAQRRERVEGSLLASPETLSGSTCVFQVVVRDPFGHVWALATIQEVLSRGEIENRLRGFAEQRKD